MNQAVIILTSEHLAILNLPELHLMLGVGQMLYYLIIESMTENEIRIHKDNSKQIVSVKVKPWWNFEGNLMPLLLKHHGDLFLKYVI